MITEDYVSFETAKLLKEKGFNEPVTELNKLLFQEGKKPVLKITHQKAMKWLREVHNLFIDIYYDYAFGEGYRFSVHKLPKGTTLESHNEIYSTYEEVCEAALKYVLENLI